MHRFMNELCLNCNKFSHCNNNDLICVAKYKAKERECEELQEELQVKEQELKKIRDICNTYQMEYMVNNGVNLLTNKILQIIEGE